MRTKRDIAQWQSLVMCAFTAMALSTSMEMPLEAWWLSGLEEILYNFRYSVHSYVNVSLLYGILIYADRAVEKKKQKRNPFYAVASLGISLIWLMGEGFRIDNTLNELGASMGQMIKCGIYITGFTYLLTQLFYLLEWLLYEYSQPVCAPAVQRRHPFVKMFFLLLICWTPHWLFAYPGNTCVDSRYQIYQFFGLDVFTAHHPPIHTLLIGGLVKLGYSFGKADWGLYAIVLLQTISFAAILSYAYLTMERLHAPGWLKGLSVFVFLFSPYYTAYIGCILKDVLYSYGFLLYTIELVYLLLLGLSFFEDWKHVLLLSLATMMVYFFRNNGAHILVGSTIALSVFILLTKHEGIWRKVKALCLVVLPLVISIAAVGIVEDAYQIQSGSIKEMLSLPFQQTARYVKEHADEVTPEEQEAIDAVVEYDRLAELYDPILSDAVKATMSQRNPSAHELMTYLKTWFNQFLKHPLTYIKATVNQNYFLIYPFEPNSIVYSTTGNVERGSLLITEPEQIVPVKQMMEHWYKLLSALPVIGLLSHPAPYVLMLLAQCLYTLRRKEYSFWLLLWPAVLSVLVILLAPAVYDHPRYAFPIIYSMPVLAAFEIHLGRKAGKKQEDLQSPAVK